MCNQNVIRIVNDHKTAVRWRAELQLQQNHITKQSCIEH